MPRTKHDELFFTAKCETKDGKCQIFDVVKRRHNYVITYYGGAVPASHLCHSSTTSLQSLINEIEIVFGVKVVGIKHPPSEDFHPYR